jgi:hypothetical protein
MKVDIKPVAVIGRAILMVTLLALGTQMAHTSVLPASGDARSSVPLHIPFIVDQTGLPTFNAEIDGKPVSLFLDFGGYKNLAIKKHALENLRVTYKNETQHFTSSTGTSSAVETFIAHNFQAGTVRLSTIDGASLPDGLYRFPQDGYLGFGFLKAFLVVFDYAHGEARLYPSNNPKLMQSECGTNVFPVAVAKGVAEVSVETELGQRFFSLDTGSNQNAARPGTNPVLGAPDTLFKYEKFRLGTQDLGAESFLVIPYAAPDVDGVLGRDFFSKHIVCIDIAAGNAAVR